MQTNFMDKVNMINILPELSSQYNNIRDRKESFHIKKRAMLGKVIKIIHMFIIGM